MVGNEKNQEAMKIEMERPIVLDIKNLSLDIRSVIN